MNKTEARDLISKGFKSLTASFKSYQEKLHLDFIKDHLEKKNFSHVASYMSLPHEVSTEKINKFLADSKTHLYLPKINSTSNKLEFVLCNKKTKFRKAHNQCPQIWTSSYSSNKLFCYRLSK